MNKQGMKHGERIARHLTDLEKDARLVVGSHGDGFTGFYAYLLPRYNLDGCNTWAEVGHGETIEKAIVEALNIYEGFQKVTKRKSEEFLCTNTSAT